MSRSSNPVSELSVDSKFKVSYADSGKDAYVSAYGIARIINDPAIEQRLWTKMTEAWFPKGVEDPDLALVRVGVDAAEY